MFCKNCQAMLGENDNACQHCGTLKGQGNNFCGNCGIKIDPNTSFCGNCGANLKNDGTNHEYNYTVNTQPVDQAAYNQNTQNSEYTFNGNQNNVNSNNNPGYSFNQGQTNPNGAPNGTFQTPPPGFDNSPAKSRIAAGILGILLGGFGVHNFYLGFTGKAVAQLLITLLTCGIGAPISSVWGLIEGIMILCKSINYDAQGRPLSDN